MSPRISAAMAVVALGLLAGCGSTSAPAAAPSAPGPTVAAPTAAGSTGDSAMPGMSMPATATGSAPAAPAGGNAVAIRGFAFAPVSLRIKVGTTVTWTNSDQDPHTVAATGGQFKSGVLQTGATYTFTFTTAGRFDYLCTIHPFMTASVVVVP